MKTQQNERATYKVPEAAKVAGVGDTAIRAGIAKNEIPHLKFGRNIVIPRTAFHRWWTPADGRRARHDALLSRRSALAGAGLVRDSARPTTVTAALLVARTEVGCLMRAHSLDDFWECLCYRYEPRGTAARPVAASALVSVDVLAPAEGRAMTAYQLRILRAVARGWLRCWRRECARIGDRRRAR